MYYYEILENPKIRKEENTARISRGFGNLERLPWEIREMLWERDPLFILFRKNRKKEEFIGAIQFNKAVRKNKRRRILQTSGTFVAEKHRGKNIGMLMRRHLALIHSLKGYAKTTGEYLTSGMAKKIEALNRNPPRYAPPKTENSEGKRIAMLTLTKESDIHDIRHVMRINPQFLKNFGRKEIREIIGKELKELEKLKLKAVS